MRTSPTLAPELIIKRRELQLLFKLSLFFGQTHVDTSLSVAAAAVVKDILFRKKFWKNIMFDK